MKRKERRPETIDGSFEHPLLFHIRVITTFKTAPEDFPSFDHPSDKVGAH